MLFSHSVTNIQVPRRGSADMDKDRAYRSMGSLYLSLGSINQRHASAIIHFPTAGDIKGATQDAQSPDTDSSWAWMIVVASFLGHVLIYGVTWTIGIFYMIFLDEFGQSASTTAWLGTINTFCTLIGGPISGAIMNRFGSRPTIIIGAIISSTGLIMSMFANSYIFILISFSVITGFGLGIAYLPVIATVGSYFDRYQNMALGLAASGTGCGTFVYAPLVSVLYDVFDWRGTFLILGGLNLNLLVIGCIMRAPRPAKVNNKSLDEEKPLFDNHHSEKLEAEEGQTKENSKKISLREIFYFKIFKNVHYILLCFSNFFSLFGVSVVYVHLSSYCSTLGFSNNDSSMLLSSLGIANLIGRIVFGLLSQKLSSLGMYSLSLVGIGCLSILFPIIKNYIALIILSILFGFFSAPIGSLLGQVLIRVAGMERLSNAYGYVLFFEAIGFLLGGPVAGFLFDHFGTYLASFTLAGIFLVLSGLLIIPPLYLERPCKCLQAATPEIVIYEEDEDE